MAVNNHRPIATALLALLISTVPTSSQPHPPPPATNNPASYASTVSPTLSIFVVAFIAVFILLIFFFIYLRFCVGRRPTVTPAAIALSLHEPRNRGLDSALLASFPTMAYSDVKTRKLGEHALECAVCLCEFEGRDVLRFIPSCSHVFHRDCIAVWLDSHVTCPVCRRNLAIDSGSAAAVFDRELELADLVRIGSERRGVNRGSVVSRGDWEERVAAGGREERFRLRLPEDVRRKLGRSASLGVSPAGREKDGRVWFWRSLRLPARDGDLDGKSRGRSDGGDDSKAGCSQV